MSGRTSWIASLNFPDPPKVMHRPNLFSYATSELSQDAFLCWLINWADRNVAHLDEGLHAAALELISTCLSKHGRDMPARIEKLKITRQHLQIDVLALINDDLLLLIEDKVFTTEHSDQLKRYFDDAVREYDKREVIPIYIQVGEQSSHQFVHEAKYAVVGRGELMRILSVATEKGSRNNILLDYQAHLGEIDAAVGSYLRQPISSSQPDWSGLGWQGFFKAIQEHRPHARWGYVPNASGGFMALWWHWHEHDGYARYLQIQEKDLCFKLNIPDRAGARSLADEWSQRFISSGEALGLPIKRPRVLRLGKTMTVAVLHNFRVADASGLLDLEATLKAVERAERAFDSAGMGTEV